MNEIEIQSIIKRKNLNEKDYFNTLINEAYSNGILNNEDITKIQIQLIELLDKIVYKYNGLESSSVRKEILEEISISNIYTIGLYLKTLNSPDEAIKYIKENNLNFIYSKGRKIIEKILNIIRVYYIKVLQNKLNVDNSIYNDTVVEGIKGFLKKYNPDFKSYDYIITADYPLFNNIIGKLEGVEFIEKYLESLYLENKFCKFFSEEKIKQLLCTYSSRYKDLIINIFEIVLLEVLACELVNKNPQDLIISQGELDKIYAKFNKKSKIEIKNEILNLYKKVKEEIFIEEKELQDYIEKNISYIVDLVENALKLGTLNQIFITEKFVVI